MKILFICGSLEPGQDGVGDYTRRLACELIRQGYKTSIISLYDHVVPDVCADLQQSEGTKVPTLRIPFNIESKKRLTVANKWIVDFGTTIISLQFVVFSFHKKGLPIGLAKQLKSLGNGKKWHLMLHELWVGMPVGASKKHMLWGWIQKQIVFSIIRTLTPKVIQTQCKLYELQLERYGFKPSYLPLFSNIPVNSTSERTKEDVNSSVLKLVIFGSIHPNAMIDELIEEILFYKQSVQKEVVLTLIGRSGLERENWITKWKIKRLKVVVLGDQSPDIISKTLMNSSIGIFTGAIQMADKSGTVAAMLDHGLPVICVSKLWQVRGIPLFEQPKGIYTLTHDCLRTCLTHQKQPAKINTVSESARLLIESLHAV
jgi:hypothetical protein